MADRTNYNFSYSNLRAQLRIDLPVMFAAAGTGLTATTNNGTVTLSIYSPPSISSFVNDHSVVEIGSTVTSTVLTWVLTGGAITSQSLDNSIGSLSTSLRSYTNISSYANNRTYTLSISDGTTSPTATSSVLFEHQRYWGVGASSGPSDANLIASSSEFATSRVKGAFSISPAAQYVWFAYPASFGAASFTVNGLLNTAWTLTTRNLVNASGNTTSYNVYVSNTVLTGTYTLTVN